MTAILVKHSFCKEFNCLPSPGGMNVQNFLDVIYLTFVAGLFAQKQNESLRGQKTRMSSTGVR